MTCGVSDPARIIFNFFDYHRTGVITRQEWSSMLQCFNLKAAREGIRELKTKMEHDFGGISGVFAKILEASVEKSCDVENVPRVAQVNPESTCFDALCWSCRVCQGRC